MKSLPYILSAQADADLEDIFDYSLDEFGYDQAVAYLLSIENVFEKLGFNPELGPKRNEIRSGLRSFSISSHIVFYRIREDHIWIVRVLHGSRDLPKFLT